MEDRKPEELEPWKIAELEARPVLEAQVGQVWNTEELRNDFEVLGFAAPFVVVKRRSDGARGSLMFDHRPRFYYSFTAD